MAQQRRDEEAAANAARKAAAYAKADDRTKMKGKNKPTRRQKKKQMNIIEDRKPVLRLKLQQEVRGGWGVVVGVCCQALRAFYAGVVELGALGRKAALP